MLGPESDFPSASLEGFLVFEAMWEIVICRKHDTRSECSCAIKLVSNNQDSHRFHNIAGCAGCAGSWVDDRVRGHGKWEMAVVSTTSEDTELDSTCRPYLILLSIAHCM